MPGQVKTFALVSNGLQEQLAFMLKIALSITGDKGHLQLFDPLDCSLKIVAESGFEEEFLNFFAATREGESACGTALLRRERIIVEDVCSDPIFLGTEAREVLLRAGVRAVQSTPLLSHEGRLVGVLSTHYHKPTRPSESALRMLDKLAKSAGRLMGCVALCRPEPEAAEPLLEEELIEENASRPHAYSLFCRTGPCVSFIESVAGWKMAIERLKTLSLMEPGEFVLFYRLNVVAMSRGGVLEVRTPAIRDLSDRQWLTRRARS